MELCKAILNLESSFPFPGFYDKIWEPIYCNQPEDGSNHDTSCCVYKYEIASKQFAYSIEPLIPWCPNGHHNFNDFRQLMSVRDKVITNYENSKGGYPLNET